MERNNKIPQLYGYAVCLICVITVLISSSNIVSALFDLADPVRSNRNPMATGMPITSFSAYKRAHSMRAPNVRPMAGTAAPAATTDGELLQMYRDDRAEHVGSVRYQSMRSLVSGLLMILLAAALFLTHWKWLRRQSAQTA